MPNHIALPLAALTNLAHQLESGMIVGPALAKELRALLAAAKPAVPWDWAERAVRELQRYPCRTKDCVACGLVRELEGLR